MGEKRKREETYAHLWLIHVDEFYQYCKAIILQLKINKFLKQRVSGVISGLLWWEPPVQFIGVIAHETLFCFPLPGKSRWSIWSWLRPIWSARSQSCALSVWATPRSSNCVPSSASGWERYARPAAAPGRTGLHWASGGGAPASLLLYQGGLLSSQEREVGRVDSVGGPSFSICSKIRWFQGLCMCVFVCPCLYERLWPVINHREATCSHKGKWVSKSPAFSFSVFSLESAWVDGLAHTWWFLCVPQPLL